MRQPLTRVLEEPRLTAAVMLSGLAVIVACEANSWLAVYSALLCIAILSAMTALLRLVRLATEHTDLMSLPLSIARDPETLDLFRSIGVALRDVAANLDPIYRELALESVRQIAQETKAIGRGEIVFQGTEAWRAAYEKLLRSRGLGRYRSVSYVHTPAYWQDEPGRQSMRVNFDTVRSGLRIERIVIIADELWPASERLPIEPIAGWLDEQARQGIRLRLVRASKVDEDLRGDFGLYGNRAAGRQLLDDQGRTTRFILSFDFAELLAAEARWDRLEIYAASFEETLDPAKACT